MLEIKINESDNTAGIIIVGVGGTDNNAVNRMVDESIAGVEFIDVNTDKWVLQFRKVPTVMQIGEKLTRGLGTRARPGAKEKAAEESSEEILQALKSADMVLVICGMDGGTGTGAASVAVKIAEDMGILTVGVVIKPFRFEVRTHTSNALEDIEDLKNSVDTSVVIPNDRFLEIVDRRITTSDALERVDEALQQAIQDITDLINVPGLTNLDFAGVQTVMIDKGVAYIGIGKAKGDDKVAGTVKWAVFSPLLETTIEDASHVIINISGDISLTKANEAASYVQELAGDEANIISGVTYDGDAQDETSIMVTATGLDEYGANASVSSAMKGSTSNFRAKPSVVAATVQAPCVVVPEVTVTASSLYSRQSQGHTPSFSPSLPGNQGYNPPKYNPSQGYNTSSIQNPAPAPGQSFRPVVDKEIQVNVLGFLKNRR